MKITLIDGPAHNASIEFPERPDFIWCIIDVNGIVRAFKEPDHDAACYARHEDGYRFVSYGMPIICESSSNP